MRREEMWRALKRLQEGLKQSMILKALVETLQSSSGKREFSVAMLAAIKEWSILVAKYGPTEKQLIQTLGLSDLDHPEFWSELVNKAPGESVVKLYNLGNFVVDQLDKVVELIKPEAIHSIEVSGNDRQSPYHGKKLLSVLVIEQPGRFSTPDRLSQVLISIGLLYEVCATIEGLTPQELSVVACDSGSDKSFELLGVAKAIDSAKEIIVSIWDRVVFFKERKMETQIELIAKSLPIIDHIGQLERENKLGPEEAEILRRKVTEGASKFIQCGAIIPEIEERAASYNPRVLMAPESKLLSAPTEGPSLAKIGGRKKRAKKANQQQEPNS